MHTDTPITLRLENVSAAIVGSGQREAFTLYHHRGSYLTEDDPYRTAAHEPQPFLGYSREVITGTGEVVRQINYASRWRPTNAHLRERELEKWNQPRPGDLIVTGTIERIVGEQPTG